VTELSNRPLLPTRSDRALYTERLSVDGELRRATERHRNVLLVGDRGSGKSTTLHAHAYDLRAEGATVAYCDLSPVDTVDDALRVIHRELERYRDPPPGVPVATGATSASGPGLAVDLVRSLAGGPQGLFLIVDNPTAEVAFSLFGRLRDELWQLRYAWIVAATPEVADALSFPPADAFFDRRVELPTLNAAERRRMLATRAPEADQPTIDLLAETGADNVRGFISAAREIFEGGAPADIYLRGLKNRAARAAHLGRAAAMAHAELEALGPVSASDATLLTRLSWTKARASRVLNELEDAGVVTASERVEGPGRPRKVYHLVDPKRFA
jgi:hypothetical protein